MTSKLTKSKIQVSGEIGIHIPGRIVDGFQFTNTTVIELEPLKQSKSGVYEILNKFNGKRYIGNSKNMRIRKNHHWWDLEKGKHKSKEMQQDLMIFLDKLMCENENNVFIIDDIFEFNVIIYCEVSELEFWERLLIDNIHPEYNTKKKKELSPKVFDINGDKLPKFEPELLNYIPEMHIWSIENNKTDDDCVEEIM
jgi:hypothetical protein